MPQAGFETTTPVFKRGKTNRAVSNRPTGYYSIYQFIREISDFIQNLPIRILILFIPVVITSQNSEPPIRYGNTIMNGNLGMMREEAVKVKKKSKSIPVTGREGP
jgi:hypothetical protein